MPLITDRHLLIIEPNVFTSAAAASTIVLSADDAAVSGTTLSSALSDFDAADINSGHVAVFDGDALEVISRLSATTLDVSRPRAWSMGDDAKIMPEQTSDKSLKVPTFARLIERTQYELLQSLGIAGDDDSTEMTALESVLNPTMLKRLIAMRTLERAFAIAASLEPDDPSLHALAAIYREAFRAVAASATIVIDSASGQTADVLRSLATTTLWRA